MTRAARVALALALLLLFGACEPATPRARSVETTAAMVMAGAASDSVTAVRVALDTLARLGARDYVADSLIRRGDTVTVWTGPRVWMATDRPMTAVSVVRPARVVAVRHVYGG